MLKRALIAAALIASGLSSPALTLAAQDRTAGATRTRPASNSEKRYRPQWHALACRSREGRAATARNFEAIDANRDGQIGPEEIRAWRRSQKGERRARADAARAKFDQHFARADADGDAALSRAKPTSHAAGGEEFRAHRRRSRRPRHPRRNARLAAGETIGANREKLTGGRPMPRRASHGETAVRITRLSARVKIHFNTTPPVPIRRIVDFGACE